MGRGGSSQPDRFRPPEPASIAELEELLQSAELAFSLFVGVGCCQWLGLPEQMEIRDRVCQSPSERVPGFWGPFAPLGWAARLTLGPEHRVHQGAGSKLGEGQAAKSHSGAVL